ncbi:unnamed protein product [Mytilus coruscus]|uniref:C2H2-type domain-containing protein n=1 Tax=Mytilus coruscus TaxID=42192 RepID=A0A6J8CNE2_MYTCO|nr:unnamed protein product [Mytilus coruscus]
MRTVRGFSGYACGVIVTALKGMYISKSQFSNSTDQNMENRRKLCCGEYFNEETHVSLTVVHGMDRTRYHCLQCDKSYTQRTKHNSHVKLVHENTLDTKNVQILRRNKEQKNKQAQIMMTVPNRNIDNLTLTLQKCINTELTNVYGCSILPDGRLVFSNYYPYMISVLKSDGSKDFEMDKIGDTFDVVYIGDDSIAITTRVSKNINIINIKKRKVEKTIQVNSNSDGVVYKDGHLIYCAKEKGLKMISLNDESTSNVTNNKLSDYAYVTTSGDKLFYTDPDNNSVTCCDYHGEILWTFCNENVLRRPFGISVDNDENAFVVGYLSNTVVVISPDGQRFRLLLSSEDGLLFPQVLHYDQSTNTLLVANQSEDAWLYEVKDARYSYF